MLWFEIIEGWDKVTIDWECTPIVWPEIIEGWDEIKMDW
jgi:hypothetical protein